MNLRISSRFQNWKLGKQHMDKKLQIPLPLSLCCSFYLKLFNLWCMPHSFTGKGASHGTRSHCGDVSTKRNMRKNRLVKSDAKRKLWKSYASLVPLSRTLPLSLLHLNCSALLPWCVDSRTAGAICLTSEAIFLPANALACLLHYLSYSLHILFPSIVVIIRAKVMGTVRNAADTSIISRINQERAAARTAKTLIMLHLLKHDVCGAPSFISICFVFWQLAFCRRRRFYLLRSVWPENEFHCDAFLCTHFAGCLLSCFDSTWSVCILFLSA